MRDDCKAFFGREELKVKEEGGDEGKKKNESDRRI